MGIFKEAYQIEHRNNSGKQWIIIINFSAPKLNKGSFILVLWWVKKWVKKVPM